MRLVNDDAWAIMTIYQEASGESFRGKAAVARVIRNRMRMRYQSDGTVPGTVLRAYQFSGWNTKDGNRIRVASLEYEEPAVRECLQAWHMALNNDFGVGDAVLYYNLGFEDFVTKELPVH